MEPAEARQGPARGRAAAVAAPIPSSRRPAPRLLPLDAFSTRVPLPMDSFQTGQMLSLPAELGSNNLGAGGTGRISGLAGHGPLPGGGCRRPRTSTDSAAGAGAASEGLDAGVQSPAHAGRRPGVWGASGNPRGVPSPPSGSSWWPSS